MSRRSANEGLGDPGSGGAPGVMYQPGSGSIQNPMYWWYRVRADLMSIVFAPHVPARGRVVDVGSADGPSASWIDELADRISVDLDPRGLHPGGICASGDRLPLPDASADGVAAFDVIEHFQDEDTIVRELTRILRPGGVLLASVPACQWAWSRFDVNAGHYRRYTRRRFRALLRSHGFEIRRATYAFGGTFPLFAADRLRARILRSREERVADSKISPTVERVLIGMSGLDRRLLPNRNLPFGSSVFVVAKKP